MSTPTDLEGFTDEHRERLERIARHLDEQAELAGFQAQIDSFLDHAAFLRQLANRHPTDLVGPATKALADFDDHGDYEAPVDVLRRFVSSSDQTDHPQGGNWALGQVLRHPTGSEWELIEHIGGEEDDWLAECVQPHPGGGSTSGWRRTFHREYMDRTFAVIAQTDHPQEPQGGEEAKEKERGFDAHAPGSRTTESKDMVPAASLGDQAFLEMRRAADPAAAKAFVAPSACARGNGSVLARRRPTGQKRGATMTEQETSIAIALLERELGEVRAHRDSLREGLEAAPYPSDLAIAEQDRDLFHQRLQSLEARLRSEIERRRESKIWTERQTADRLSSLLEDQ